MGVVELLVLSLAAFGVVCGSKCVPETAKCSEHWVKIEPHKNFMESAEELEAWCNKQRLFYKCLEDILLAGKNGNLSYLPVNLLISTMVSDDLCLEISTNRRRYLSTAACINKLNTDFCFRPEYLETTTAPDQGLPGSACSLSEKTSGCIAATLILKCGFDAGKIYKALLKVTRYSDEVCNTEGAIGIIPCREPQSRNVRKDEKLSDVYYGLINRIGSIPEQIHEQDGSITLQESTTTSESIEHDVITEAIRSALDSLDGDYLPGTEQPEKYKIPIITEPFKNLLFYNFSGLQYTMYWRIPDNSYADTVSCAQLYPSYAKEIEFFCVFSGRYRDPFCVQYGEDEPVTPELIAEIDPDVPVDSVYKLDPNPYWMEEINELKRERELREGTSTRPPGFEWLYGPSMFSEELHSELVAVLVPNPHDAVLPRSKRLDLGRISAVSFYDDFHNITENVTCSRVNECHPRGRGIFKCTAMPRNIEVCDECYEGTSTSEPVYDSSVPTGLPQMSTSTLESLTVNTEPSVLEGSGSQEEDTSSEDLINLLFSGETSSPEKNIPYGDTEKLKPSKVSESSAESTTDVHFLLLPEDPTTESNEDSAYIPEFVYTVDEGGILKNTGKSQLSSDQNGALDEKVFVLQGVPSTNNEKATYAIFDTSEDWETSEVEDLVKYRLHV